MRLIVPRGKGRGPIRIRAEKCNPGKVGHAPHKPGNYLNKKEKPNVARMIRYLSEHKWQFHYFVEAIAPESGWKYHGEGPTPESAFLKAFERKTWDRQ